MPFSLLTKVCVRPMSLFCQFYIEEELDNDWFQFQHSSSVHDHPREAITKA
jgi:hypothetical protein